MWSLSTFGGTLNVVAERYHHGNLRKALLDAALALFAERGRFDFTMRELARAAGVTHNAPYRHFADREALLDALAADGFVELRARSLAAMEGEKDPRERVGKLGEVYVRFALAQPHHFRLMFMRPIAEASGELAAPAHASFAVLEDAIRDAADLGLLREGLDMRDVVVSAWSLVHGLASLAVSGQVPQSARAIRRYTHALGEVFAGGAFVGPRRERG
jgi:AcrR family transcriptional regulator